MDSGEIPVGPVATAQHHAAVDGGLEGDELIESIDGHGAAEKGIHLDTAGETPGPLRLRASRSDRHTAALHL